LLIIIILASILIEAIVNTIDEFTKPKSITRLKNAFRYNVKQNAL